MRILDAAREVFVERGLDGARMQDIADKAGINKALLHYYFRNKEKLFELILKKRPVSFFLSLKGSWVRRWICLKRSVHWCRNISL